MRNCCPSFAYFDDGFEEHVENSKVFKPNVSYCYHFEETPVHQGILFAFFFTLLRCCNENIL